MMDEDDLREFLTREGLLPEDIEIIVDAIMVPYVTALEIGAMPTLRLTPAGPATILVEKIP